jgi:hypothetical protein
MIQMDIPSPDLYQLNLRSAHLEVREIEARPPEIRLAEFWAGAGVFFSPPIPGLHPMFGAPTVHRRFMM